MTKLYCISHLIFEFAVVKSQWIIECYTQRKLLPTDSYKVKTFIDDYEERLAHKDAELTKVRKALAEAGPPRKKAVNKLEKTEGPLPSLLGIVDFTALAVQQKQRVAKAIRSKQGYTYRQSGREDVAVDYIAEARGAAEGPFLQANAQPFVSIGLLAYDAVAVSRGGQAKEADVVKIVMQSPFVNQQSAAKKESDFAKVVGAALHTLQAKNIVSFDMAKSIWMRQTLRGTIQKVFTILF